MSTCRLLLLSQADCGLIEYPHQRKPPLPKELSVICQSFGHCGFPGENKPLFLEKLKTSERYKPIGDCQLTVFLKDNSGQSRYFCTFSKSMPAEHCEVSELIAMDSSEPSAQTTEPCMSLDERDNSLDYTEHQKVNGQINPSVHSSGHYYMNGEQTGDGKPSVDYNGHSMGFEKCISMPCGDYPSFNKHSNPCNSSELSKSFEECTQHCKCSEFRRSSNHSANDCLAVVFSQHCTEHFQASELCQSSDKHCMSFEPSEPAKNSDFFEQCKLPDYLPEISESTESIRPFEQCTGICEDSRKYNHIEHPIEYNKTKEESDDLKMLEPAVQQIEICGLFDSEFCIILEPVLSSDSESRHVSEVHEPTEQTVLDEQSSHRSAEYDIPSGHYESENNLFELRETSVQYELSERCNSCESCPGQHRSTHDKCYEPCCLFDSEEDRSSECSSTDTRSFESFIDDIISSDTLHDLAESYEALVEDVSLDKSRDGQSPLFSEMWESFDVHADVAACEDSSAAEDKLHLDAVAVEELFDFFDKDNTYTFAQRQPYTSCFEGGGVHELFVEQQKSNVSIINEDETYMPSVKKGLETLSVEECKMNDGDVFNLELEAVDEAYDACAEDRQCNVDCADDIDVSDSGSFADEESCESCFEEGTAYRVVEAFLPKDNAIEVEAYESCVEEDTLCGAEEKACNVQAGMDNMNEHTVEEASCKSSADLSSVEYDEAFKGQNDQTLEPCFKEKKTSDQDNQTIAISEDKLYKPHAGNKASEYYEGCDEDCDACSGEYSKCFSRWEDDGLCTEDKTCVEGCNEYKSQHTLSDVNQEANGFCTEENSHKKFHERMDNEGTLEPILDGFKIEEGENDAQFNEESEYPQSFVVLIKDSVLCTEGSKPVMPDGIEFNGDQTDSSTTSSEEIDEQNKSSESCDDLNRLYLTENWEEHNGISEHLQPLESQDLLEQVSDVADHSKDSIDIEPPEQEIETSKQRGSEETTECHPFFKIVASEQPSEDSEEELSDDESSGSCECEFCVPPIEQVPAKPLLPQIKSKDSGKICVVLDLDETLVHSSFKPVNNADFIIPVEIDGTVHQVYVLKRPHVDEYLKRMGELFECVLFTASLSKYADPVSDLLDKWGAFRHRLFRESCVFHRGNYVKDLSRLGRELNKVVIVDNSPASYIFHPDNAVPVASWFDDMADTELLDLIPFFERLSKVDDVYDILKQQRTAS
ncbi:uncharacterized protein LOC105026538 isoform X1 [Esox lucius]|uniref:uncharacterized protein LOC105026538 isoform X1 n=1 Tax=Esox lucius TaxID=8010 RepID=UPI001476BA76|nr:uncharacterized protein LOC105026538 isoform X1 [Esox lucius]